MIKPEEMMLGDLIYNHRHWICPVTGINEECVQVIAKHYGELTYRWEDTYPIPLTEEIILQLGWKEIMPDDPKYKNGIGVGKQYKHPAYTDVLNIVQNSLTKMYWTLAGEVYVENLNDLQHVLHQTVKDRIITDGDKVMIDTYRFWENDGK